MEDKTLQAVGRAITEDAVQFAIPVRPRNRLHHWLQHKNWSPQKRFFEIRPITLGNLSRISVMLLKMGIDAKKVEQTHYFVTAYELAAKYPNTVPRIVATAITNLERKPDEALIRFLKWNLDSKNMAQLLTIVFAQLNTVDFVASIYSMTGMQLLKSETKKQP